MNIHTIVSQKSAHRRSTLQVCQRGVWALFRLFVFNHWRAPTSCLQWLDLPKANNWTNNNVQQNPSGFKVESWCFSYCKLDGWCEGLGRRLTVLLKLHTKPVPWWALNRVKFEPIQKIGPKVEGRHSFVSSHSFVRLRYIHTYILIHAQTNIW